MPQMVGQAPLLALIILLCVCIEVQPSVQCNVKVTDALGYEVPTSHFIIGLSYTLTCQCQNVNQVVNYQWKKNNYLLSGEVGSTHSLSHLKLSDAGRYTCNITTNMVNYGSSIDITIQIPAPSYVIIRSDKSNPIRPVGSAVNLMCSVGLHYSAIVTTVPLNVSIHLTSPSGMVLNTTTLSVSGSTYRSYATIDSFERNQTGVYTCEATLTSPSQYLSESSTLTEEITLTSGAYISMGVRLGLQNNTCAYLRDVGSSPPHQLACITDRTLCCQTQGQWYYPNGSQIKHNSGQSLFYVERTNWGNVNLFRRNNVLEPYGEFCCRIADAADVVHTLCVNLVPQITVEIADKGVTPVAGQNYSMSCSVSGTNIDFTTLMYNWKKDNTSLHETGALLSFSPLRLSHAGEYSCSISMLECPSMTSHTGIKALTIQEVTNPISVNFISNPVSPIGRSGGNVNLICVATLSSVVDIPVTVQILVTTPDHHLLPSQTAASNSTSYTSRAVISSFRNDQAGIYTCTITLSSSVFQDSITIESIHIYAGVHLSFKGMTYSNNSIFFINEIGRTSSNSAIQCVTDKQECCFSRPNRFGKWYFPNGTHLPKEHDPIDGFATHFYRNRGDDGTVSLNRVSSSVASPTGRFCCELPDSTHEQQSLCAYIVDVEIIESVTPQLGLSDYSLTCIVSGADSQSLRGRIAYQWFDNTQTRIEGSTSVLSLSPLTLSSAGRYICEVTLLKHPANASNTILRASRDVVIPIPSLMELRISSSPSSPIRPELLSTAAVILLEVYQQDI